MAISPPFSEEQSLFVTMDGVATPPPTTPNQNLSGTTTTTRPKLILPSAYHDKKRSLNLIDRSQNDEFKKYLRHDLDVLPLNKVHKHLWFAGLPQNTRPLHSHIMIGRQIMITERADLHLIWKDDTIYIKPLPEYLANYSIWKESLCKDHLLFQDAKGFLLSYMSLISYKSDLKIAHERDLISRKINWEQWTAFSKAVLSNTNLRNLEQINPRYLYGDLRQARLNTIYRCCRNTRSFGTFMRGYHHEYHQYSTFLERNFTWILTVFVYITIVLTATQAGLATGELKDDGTFNRASYGFAIFSILAPLAFVVLIAIIMLPAVLLNLCYTLRERKTSKLTYRPIFENEVLKEKWNGHPNS